MEISNDAIKALREKTGISVMQCKKALEEAGGDMDKAVEILKEKSAAIALKKGDRTLGGGTVSVYKHANGSIGAMVELLSETDFVSNNEEFKKMAYDIAMHISATNPKFVHRSDVDEEASKTADDVFYKEHVLMEQDFIKNPSLTIQGLIEEAVQKFGEKIDVGQMARFAIFEK